MKKYINILGEFISKGVILIVIALLTMPLIIKADSQEKKKIKYRMSLTYNKFFDGSKSLTVGMRYRKETSFVNISNALIGFYLITDKGEIKLADIKTNENGKALLRIAADYKLPWDADNYCTFAARFDGNEEGKATDEEILIKDIDIDFNFTEDSEEKYINVSITESGDSGARIPIYDALVNGYVERMFSLLPIIEDFSDEDGKLISEFPNDLPGDSLGNLIVIVSIIESDEYGTVEMKKTIDWGIPVDFSETETPRALWTDEAPVWMAITVLIILLGAWLNFALAIYKVSKIKGLSKSA